MSSYNPHNPLIVQSDRSLLLEVENEYYEQCRELVALKNIDSPCWHADLTRIGVDLVEYTVSCEPGIARPQKYW